MKTNIVGTKIAATILTCLLLAGCAHVRSIVHWTPDIDDHKIFPATEIAPSSRPFTFHEGSEQAREAIEEWIVEASGWFDADTVDMPLGKYLSEKSKTTAFLVIRNDSILFEHYYRGYDREKISTVFSVSKSVTSLLTGIAVDEGYIESVHDPVTKYIPELTGKDARFQRLTIEHLLDMRSGFKFDENYSGFFGKIAVLHYGKNRLGQMKRMRFEREPGDWPEGDYNYQSATTAMLGLVVERATGRNLAKYLSEKVWEPMGMENAASWSLDDRRHRAAKADSGLNTTARDLAKIGRLYLKNGDWNGRQIVDSEWIERTVTPNPMNGGYQYQWYSYPLNLTNSNREDKLWDSPESADKSAANNAEALDYSTWKVWEDRSGDGWRVMAFSDNFYAMGLMKQVVYVDPDKNLIMVRLGESGDKEYETLFWKLSKIL